MQLLPAVLLTAALHFSQGDIYRMLDLQNEQRALAQAWASQLATLAELNCAVGTPEKIDKEWKRGDAYRAKVRARLNGVFAKLVKQGEDLATWGPAWELGWKTVEGHLAGALQVAAKCGDVRRSAVKVPDWTDRL